MGGFWAWTADCRNTNRAFLSLSSPRCHVDEDVQVDVLLIVEQIRDNKDARYVLVFRLQNACDSNIPL